MKHEYTVNAYFLTYVYLTNIEEFKKLVGKAYSLCDHQKVDGKIVITNWKLTTVRRPTSDELRAISIYDIEQMYNYFNLYEKILLREKQEEPYNFEF